MGAGSSNSIKNISIDQDNGDGFKSDKLNREKSTIESVRQNEKAPADASNSSSGNDKVEIEKLTQQLCESESQRLDLEDRIQCLEEQLERANAQTIEQAEKPCDETLHAKDHYIAKLEKEKKDAETECHKMKVRHRKKVKQLNTQMAEYKQEVNFQMMELREEIDKLKLEHKGKSSKPSQEIVSSFPDIGDSPKLPGGEKMKLILELSEQVTEQQDKISKHERNLSDKDQIIGELRAKLKNHTGYLKALNESNDGRKGTASCAGASVSNKNNSNMNRLPVNHANRNTNLSPNSNKSAYSARKNDESAKIDALFTLDEEEDFSDQEDGSMDKLSSLLMGVKASNKKTRLSNDSLDVDDGEEKDADSRHKGSLVDESDSGNGRDSGLGSAGKREEERIGSASKSVSRNVLPDWRDSGSGLSDSDFEREYSFGSKVSSAPPKLQNGGNSHCRKAKKKSNSLRKRGSGNSNDRPPRPGMAFMNSVVEETNVINVQGCSSLISPVQVS